MFPNISIINIITKCVCFNTSTSKKGILQASIDKIYTLNTLHTFLHNVKIIKKIK